MKNFLYLILVLIGRFDASAQINLASGTTGTTTGVAQSFNETRGVDVTVVAHADISLISMTLNGFFCGQGGTATAYVGARIYDINTAQLLASGMDTVSNVYGGSVTVQIPFVLLANASYRLCFFCGGPNPPTTNAATEFIPQAFPYFESTNSLQISHAYAYPADTMPSNYNIMVPLITLHTKTTELDELSDIAINSAFPNPSKDVSTLRFENKSNQALTLFILDTEGKIVRTMSNIFTDNVAIERKELANGIYFYKLKSEETIVAKGKLIFE